MTMRAVDLFAGLGGLSVGARMAQVETVWAGNHWRAACDCYAANHPIRPICQDLMQADWRTVPSHDVLMAAPACQGHSPARGKDRPHHDALRSTAWAVVACAECHKPPCVVVENVVQFLEWALFPAWSHAMQRMGYALSPFVIDAADHGVPQHRRRVFIVATRSRHPIELRLPRREHVAAGTVVDFAAGRWSPVNRPGRSQRTLARIEAGRRRHGARFVAPYYGSGSGETGRSLLRPFGTITTRDRWAIIDGDRMRMASKEECRAAMGFPPSFVLPKQHKAAVHMLGNSVCPPVAADLFRAIRRAG